MQNRFHALDISVQRVGALRAHARHGRRAVLAWTRTAQLVFALSEPRGNERPLAASNQGRRTGPRHSKHTHTHHRKCSRCVRKAVRRRHAAIDRACTRGGRHFQVVSFGIIPTKKYYNSNGEFETSTLWKHMCFGKSNVGSRTALERRILHRFLVAERIVTNPVARVGRPMDDPARLRPTIFELLSLRVFCRQNQHWTTRKVASENTSNGVLQKKYCTRAEHIRIW